MVTTGIQIVALILAHTNLTEKGGKENQKTHLFFLFQIHLEENIEVKIQLQNMFLKLKSKLN